MTATRVAGTLSKLDRARRRRDEAAQGSPDWDAASEAVMELEADIEPPDTQAPRQLFQHVARPDNRSFPLR